MTGPKEVHYLVGVADEPVAHIHAKDQIEAVRKFVTGDNTYGYEADEYDGQDVIIIAFSKADTYMVDIEPPTDPELLIVKRTKTA